MGVEKSTVGTCGSSRSMPSFLSIKLLPSPKAPFHISAWLRYRKLHRTVNNPVFPDTLLSPKFLWLLPLPLDSNLEAKLRYLLLLGPPNICKGFPPPTCTVYRTGFKIKWSTTPLASLLYTVWTKRIGCYFLNIPKSHCHVPCDNSSTTFIYTNSHFSSSWHHLALNWCEHLTFIFNLPVFLSKP